MESVCLSQLIELVGFRPEEFFLGDNPELGRVSADTRDIKSGDLFVCMPSATRDTHSFLPEIQSKGAKAAVVHSAAALLYARNLNLAALYVTPSGSHFNFVLGKLCREIFGDPSSKLRILGVTGTNGKTTTAWILRHALLNLGRKAGYLGTLGFISHNEMEVLNNTTPFPVELWQMLSAAEKAGIQDLAIEVSSHALFERRLSGVQFDVGMFTNLTQDHLDFHGSMEEYGAAKRLFFTEYAALTTKPFTACMNVNDGTGNAWSRELPCRVMTFGLKNADLVCGATAVNVDGIDFVAVLEGDRVERKLLLGGDFNVENAGTALAGLVACGYGLEESLDAIARVEPVPGRFESILNETGIGVIVDYAHTPDAVDSLLRSAKGLGSKRIITIFGCGGDRDRSKRPLMAAAASAHSDIVVVTSDNPRTEDPELILDDVCLGLKEGIEVHRILDRKEAIFFAVQHAEPGDLVVIAGKGHEDYQIIGRTKYPMDDRVLAREALALR